MNRTLKGGCNLVTTIPVWNVAGSALLKSVAPRRDDLDVTGIRDRKSLVAFLATHKGMTFVHGMGVGCMTNWPPTSPAPAGRFPSRRTEICRTSAWRIFWVSPNGLSEQ